MSGNHRDVGDEFVIERLLTPEDIDRYKQDLICAAVNYIHGEETDFFATAQVGESVHFERVRKVGQNSFTRLIIDAYVEEITLGIEDDTSNYEQNSSKCKLLRYGRVILEWSQDDEMTERVIESLQPPDEIGRSGFLAEISPNDEGKRPVKAWEVREYQVVSDKPCIEVSNYFELQFEDGDVYASDEDMSAEAEDGELLTDDEEEVLEKAQQSFDSVFTVEDYMLVRNGLLDAAVYV